MNNQKPTHRPSHPACSDRRSLLSYTRSDHQLTGKEMKKWLWGVSVRPLDSDLRAYTCSQEGLNPLDWNCTHVNLNPVASQTRPITTLVFLLLLQSVHGSKRMYKSRDRPSIYYSGCAHVVPRNTTRISSASTLFKRSLP